jgi:formylglycine-generating enzyme
MSTAIWFQSVPRVWAPHPGMEWIPGGRFMMGSDRHDPEESPAHEVILDGFWIDRAPVTNAAFRGFVEATGYVTVAERRGEPGGRDGAEGSAVFRKPAAATGPRDHATWWLFVRGADWRHPQGPDSSLAELDHHPVVHVTYADAVAYARWAEKQLPTEAEWEFAARGGLEGAEFAWGDDLNPGGRAMANTWQGRFPFENLLTDGFEGTSPVGSFPANGYGLYDVVGNVWEWTSDWYENRHRAGGFGRAPRINPRGGDCERSYDPAAAVPLPRKVVKGGSFLCAPSHCRCYRPGARRGQAIDGSTCNLGFRCVIRGSGEDTEGSRGH